MSAAHTKYTVWIKERGQSWCENGDGPVTQLQANRIAREIASDFGIPTRVLPLGEWPGCPPTPYREKMAERSSAYV